MASPQISDHIFRWRDEMAKTSPRQADYAVSVLGAMLTWSKRRGLIEENRAAGVGDTYSSNRRSKVWTAADETALHKHAHGALRHFSVFAIETGLAQQDLLALPKTAIRGNVIVTRRLKNGTDVAIPISSRLADVINELPQTDSAHVLNKPDGRPWDAKGNGIRSAFREACALAKISGLTFHDQRGTYVTRRRSMGWTAEETALTTGHKVAGEQGAQSSYVDRQTVAIANAERLWARYFGPNGEQALQTDLQTRNKKAAPEGG